jgi:putative hydrolase of the HAD superfamily
MTTRLNTDRGRQPTDRGQVVTKQPSAIAAVIFDFGGVLTNDPFRMMTPVAEALNMTHHEFAAIAIGMGEYGAGDHPWHQLERDEIHVDDYNAAVIVLAQSMGHPTFPPLPVERIGTLVQQLRPQMLDFIADLRAMNIATAICTNNVRALSRWRSDMNADDLVDVVIDSSEVGMRKPEARMFHHVADQLSCAPSACLFLDDMQANVDGARAIGMHTILVTDPDAAINRARNLLAQETGS